MNVVISDVWAHGGAGGRDLAEKAIQLAQEENHFSVLWRRRQHWNEIDQDCLQKSMLERYQPNASCKRGHKGWALGYKLPICMAKTQYSFSDDAKEDRAPKDFTVKISNIKVAAGAVALS